MTEDITLPPMPAGYAPEVAAAMRNYTLAAVEADRSSRVANQSLTTERPVPSAPQTETHIAPAIPGVRGPRPYPAPVAAQPRVPSSFISPSQVRALAEKWRAEQASYPSTVEGNVAASAVRCCIRELLDLLAAAPTPPAVEQTDVGIPTSQPDQQVATQDVSDYVTCGCGDMYPPDSYGAGYIDGAGQCENCDTAQPHTEAIRYAALEEAAEAIERMNDSAGDAASYDHREMTEEELLGMHTLSAAANAIRALKPQAAAGKPKTRNPALVENQGLIASSTQDHEDAERLRAMADEWNRARRGAYSPMPIWDALCEAIGNDADGNGMRTAIDAARAKEQP